MKTDDTYWYISYQANHCYGRSIELVDTVVRGDWSLWFAEQKQTARKQMATLILISAVEISKAAADVIAKTTTFGVQMQGTEDDG